METLAKIAAKHGRDYITPEDVQDVIDGGADRMKLWKELLSILGGVKELGAEDSSLCAFVAWEFKKTKTKARAK